METDGKRICVALFDGYDEDVEGQVNEFLSEKWVNVIKIDHTVGSQQDGYPIHGIMVVYTMDDEAPSSMIEDAERGGV